MLRTLDLCTCKQVYTFPVWCPISLSGSFTMNLQFISDSSCSSLWCVAHRVVYLSLGSQQLLMISPERTRHMRSYPVPQDCMRTGTPSAIKKKGWMVPFVCLYTASKQICHGNSLTGEVLMTCLLMDSVSKETKKPLAVSVPWASYVTEGRGRCHQETEKAQRFHTKCHWKGTFAWGHFLCPLSTAGTQHEEQLQLGRCLRDHVSEWFLETFSSQDKKTRADFQSSS